MLKGIFKTIPTMQSEKLYIYKWDVVKIQSGVF
jgi:hypothetical protein